MYKKLLIDNYEKLVENEKKVIHYLLDHSTYFYFTTIREKLVDNSVCFDKGTTLLTPYIIKIIEDLDEWPIDFIGKRDGEVFILLRCCEEVKTIIDNIANVFCLADDMFENIGFIKEDKLLFASITHENIAFFIDPKKSAIAFMKETGVSLFPPHIETGKANRPIGINRKA
ncbi:MAG: hypothetical protein IJA31_11280 [Clostridia bacterium]|nr:hypothetical protein [Clostridia bacterium]